MLTLAVLLLGPGLALVVWYAARLLVARMAGARSYASGWRLDATVAAAAPRRLRVLHAVAGPLAVYVVCAALGAIGYRTTDSGSADTSGRILVVPGKSAERAGLRDGDRIRSVDGRPIEHFEDIREAVQDRSAGDTVKIVADRDGDVVEVQAVLESNAGRPVIGVRVFWNQRRAGTGEALVKGLTLPFRLLGALWTYVFDAPPAPVLGPSEMVDQVTSVTSQGVGLALLTAAMLMARALYALVLLTLALVPWRTRRAPAG